ncbi:hypothetical protein [Helicobacter canadensis]|uniref:hypothetical protein n=1 Tax=Helicobacter canadensis TaxID=123841 RepID=UPI0002E6E9A4|nr:hypothetical protein [Helicobacter canadensis]
MLSQRSIRGDYTRQITISFVVLLIIFSSALYNYLYFSVYNNIKNELQTQIQHILTNNINYSPNQTFYIQSSNILEDSTLQISILSEEIPNTQYIEQKELKRTYFTILKPYKNNKTIKITKDITKEKIFLNYLFKGIILLNFFCFDFNFTFCFGFFKYSL